MPNLIARAAPSKLILGLHFPAHHPIATPMHQDASGCNTYAKREFPLTHFNTRKPSPTAPRAIMLHRVPKRAKARQTTPSPIHSIFAKRTAMTAGLSRVLFRQWLPLVHDPSPGRGSRRHHRCRRASAWLSARSPGHCASPTPQALKRPRSLHTAIRGVCS